MNGAGDVSLEAEKTWLQCESEKWGLRFNLEGTIIVPNKL